MKNILLLAFGIILVNGGSVITTHAAQYECVYTINNNSRCTGMKKTVYTCAFSEELNTLRTQEEKAHAFTFPDFCSKTCAEKSGIPKECRNGSIRKVATVPQNMPIVIAKDAPSSSSMVVSIKTSLFGVFNYVKSMPSIIYKKMRNIFNPGINFDCQIAAREGGCIPIPTATAGVRG